MKLINIESKLNNFENAISSLPLKHAGLTMIPGVMVLPGALKALVGAVQAVTAVAIFALSPLTWHFTDDISKHSFKHIIHGLGNIAAGILEMIPLVTYLIATYREELKGAQPHAKIDSPSFKLHMGHESKFLPYDTLVARDLQVLVKSPAGLRWHDIPGYYPLNSNLGEDFAQIKIDNPDASVDQIRLLFLDVLKRKHSADFNTNIVIGSRRGSDTEEVVKFYYLNQVDTKSDQKFYRSPNDLALNLNPISGTDWPSYS